MRFYFPATDYHTFNLDWLIDKFNDLAEYVRTHVTSLIDGTKVYFQKLYPYTDEEGAEHIPEFVTQDIGAQVERTTNDGDSIRFRVYSPELTTESDRGVVSLSGSEMSVKTPHFRMKDGRGNTLDIQGDSLSKKVFVNGGDNYTTYYMGDASNTNKITNVTDPENATDVATKNYVDTQDADVYSRAGALVSAENVRAVAEEGRIEALIPDVSQYVRVTEMADALQDTMDNPLIHRSATVTDTSVLKKSEIVQLIEEYISPSADSIWRNYDRTADAQYIGGLPDYTTADVMMWQIKNTYTDPDTNACGYVGYHPGSYTSAYCWYPPTEMYYNSTLTYGWGWRLYMADGQNCTLSTQMWSNDGSPWYIHKFFIGRDGVNVRVMNVATPVSGDDASNKDYVDSQVQAVQANYEARIARLETQINTLISIVRENNN